VPGDTNDTGDVFVHDRRTGITQRISLGPNSVQGNAESASPALSAGGRVVAFTSSASNLVPGDTNGQPDVFVRTLVGGR
jgi:Tol biopolymer transport system component